MQKAISYSLYKSSYSEFHAHDYDSKNKKIIVDLPDYKRPAFPKSWVRSGNSYHAPNGARIVFWNSGLSENFVIESGSGYGYKQHTVPAGLYAREEVIKYVNSL